MRAFSNSAIVNSISFATARMMRHWSGLAAVGLSLAMSPAWGSLTVYSNYTSWAAAVGLPINTVTFNGVSGGPFSAGYTEGGVLFEGISAGVWNGYLYPSNGGYCAATGCLVGPATEAGTLGSTDGYLRSTTPNPVTAVAMEVGSFVSGGDIPVWTFSNGDSYVGPAQAGPAEFIGFVSDTPFNFVDYHISVGSSGGDFTVMDTFYVPNSVPEPCTLLLLGLGVLGLSWRGRL